MRAVLVFVLLFRKVCDKDWLHFITERLLANNEGRPSSIVLRLCKEKDEND